MTGQLPRFLRDMLACPPPAGTGVHLWLFNCGRYLHHFYGSDTRGMLELLKAQSAGCGRYVPEREIMAAIRDSKRAAWTPKEGTTYSPPPEPKWPMTNREQVEAIAKDGPGLADLWERSPVRCDEDGPGAEEITNALFPGNPLLCCGKSERVFDTRPREQWRGELAGQQFTVPSPMTAVFGKTQDGRLSKHAKSNTGPRHYLVIERDPRKWSELSDDERRQFDNEEHYRLAKKDESAAVLHHLSKYLPLRLVVDSGGKSLHGWFACRGQDEAKLHRFMRYAVSLGADSKTWLPSQFVRMPNGTRDNGRRQTVYFFNPPEVAR